MSFQLPNPWLYRLQLTSRVLRTWEALRVRSNLRPEVGSRVCWPHNTLLRRALSWRSMKSSDRKFCYALVDRVFWLLLLCFVCTHRTALCWTVCGCSELEGSTWWSRKAEGSSLGPGTSVLLEFLSPLSIMNFLHWGLLTLEVINIMHPNTIKQILGSMSLLTFFLNSYSFKVLLTWRYLCLGSNLGEVIDNEVEEAIMIGRRNALIL